MPVGVSVVAQVTTYLSLKSYAEAPMEYLVGIARSLRPETGELDHPAPLLNLGCHMVAELRGSEDFWRSGDFRQPRLDGRVHQPGIDLAIKLLDDLGWRTPWRADPYPYARLGTASPIVGTSAN